MEEYKVIQRLKAGDMDSLEQLVKTYQEQAIRVAYLITQDKALAHDVVQTAFIRMYKKSHLLDASRPFAPYFFKSVANAAIRASKKQQKVISLESFSDDGQALEALTSLGRNPEKALEAQEQTEKIEALLQQLSPEKRAVIVMKYYLGYSEAEIADETNTPRGTVKSRLHKARQQLKRLLNIDTVSPLFKEELA